MDTCGVRTWINSKRILQENINGEVFTPAFPIINYPSETLEKDNQLLLILKPKVLAFFPHILTSKLLERLDCNILNNKIE